MMKILKASAGSGKTYSLAREYIRILLSDQDRYTYRHILAVTFTNKATDEMKSRILKELNILATDPSASNYRKDFIPSIFQSEAQMQKKAGEVLRDILHDYSAFSVSTIDRFFQHALKAFSREIGQYASYQVELDRDSLIAESVDRILDSLTENDKALLSWLTDNVIDQIAQGGRYHMDANLLNMSLRIQSPQRQEALAEAGLPVDHIVTRDKLNQIRECCRKIMKDFYGMVKERARAALDVIESTGLNPDDSYKGFFNQLYIYDELGDKDIINKPTDLFFARSADPERWFAKAKAKACFSLVGTSLNGPLADFCALWGAEYAAYSTSVILDRQIYGLGITAELIMSYQQLLKEKNVLSIDDSNTILHNIIDQSDAPFIYEKLGVRYDHYLLDEFQDTSSIQWDNFKSLLLNSDSQGGKNLIVGDVKQSIYRWRGSDWKLLDCEIPSEFPGHDKEILDTNYRSLKNIIDFNNDFFVYAADNLDKMAGYKDKGPMSGIYADVRQKIGKKDKQEGSVQVTYCPKEQELDQVLSSVQAALSQGASFSDIAILVRSNLSGQRVASHLIENGITVITDDFLKVKNSVTVRRLVSLMSCIDNPDDSVSTYLAHSMGMNLNGTASSLIDLAEELLRGLKERDEEKLWQGEILHIQSFMDCIQDYVSINGNTLRGFLKHWDTSDPSISSPSSGNSVKVMTVHKSKGLDFPYVIIPFAENIIMYKGDSYWCAPDLKDTPLEGVADGVYDVSLSSDAADTLFSRHYDKECFLQMVDNMNVLYVAMTRASAGMHIIARTPSAKFLNSLKKDELVPAYSDFSQLLYHYLKVSGLEGMEEEGVLHYHLGEMVDFNSLDKKSEQESKIFVTKTGDGYPSIPLNPLPCNPEEDVRERGRLKFSADSVDFFSEDGSAGIEASNRIRGIVLHDILSGVRTPDELDNAISQALLSGELTPKESEEVRELLSKRIEQVQHLGWFPADKGSVLNETAIIDTGGSEYRPDRVVINGGKIMIIDYKFGEHYARYEEKMRRYAELWRKMGYNDVSASLWYVSTGEIVPVYLGQ